MTEPRGAGGTATTVPAPHGPLAADDGGEGGPPVLFLHSLAGTRRHWTEQLERLRPGRRATALDLPGHGGSCGLPGGSGRPGELGGEVISAARELYPGRFVLVGHSFGAGAAMAAAGREPDRVAGLLLVDPVGDHRDEREEIRAFVERLRSEDGPAAAEDFWEEILAGSRAGTRSRVLADLRSTPADTVIRCMEALCEFDPAAAMDHYGGPALVVFNPRFEQRSSLHRVMPGLPRVELGDAGHWVQMDRPDRFHRILRDFLGRL